MFRRWFIIATATCILSSSMCARPGEVITRDGSPPFTGDVSETPDGKFVIIRKGSIETKLDKRNIEKIVYVQSFEDQWAERTAKLAPTDIAGRMELGRMAYEKQKYTHARDMFEQVMKIDPSHKEAANLLDLVTRQIELQRKSAANQNAPAAPARPATAAAADPASPVIEKKPLTADDINTIRQLELRKNDAFNVRFENDVLRKYLSSSNLEPATFNAMSPAEKALTIPDRGEPALHRNVRIVSDPVAMKEFRQIQPLILTGCASSSCHGGPSGGNLVLFNPAANEEAAYTNFYILQTYKRGNVAMLDRGSPERSLLLEMGLPLEMAQTPHPTVPNFRAAFRNRQDPRYNRIADWLGKTLNVVQPNYGIEYPLASNPAAVQPPATQPK